MADLYDGWWTTNNIGYLNLEHKTDNAKKVFDFFDQYGWTKNAIAGMLGNFEWESHIDPLIQSGNAFGLAQWDPVTKLQRFADDFNLDYKSGTTQCLMILHDSVAETPYHEWAMHVPMTFEQFTHSTESPSDLAYVFMRNFEVSSGVDEDLRREWAEYWYKHIGTPPIWLLFKIRRNNYERFSR